MTTTERVANFPSQGTESSGTSAVEQTTVFTSDAVDTSANQKVPETIKSTFFTASDNSVLSDIKQFLGKPKRVDEGFFRTTDVSTTFSPYSNPTAGLIDPLYTDKIRGYLGFRATSVFTLNVNAERFQQGRYMLTYVPTGGSVWEFPGTGRGTKWVNSHSSTQTQRTQLPRVEIDLNCDTQGTLRIPYSSVLDFFPFSSLPDPDRYGNWGVVRLFPYSPLDGAVGALEAKWTLFMHFEDVELIGPAVPQDTPEPEALNIDNNDAVMFQSQPLFQSSTKKRGKSTTEKEADSKGVGPISSVAFNIAKSAKYFNPLPLIGQYSAPLSWVADIVGNAASVFGWSAPNNLDAVNRIQRVQLAYATNVKKVDQSLPLSLDPSAQVEVLPGFSGTNVDELEFANFAGIPFWNYTFTMAPAQTAGTLLSQILVAPIDNIKSIAYGTTTSKHMGPCQYLAQKFAYWRGGMTYTFKIVKTEYHSGRISVSWCPQEHGTHRKFSTYASTDYIHRDIIDIREHSEFTITVPYQCSTPYMETKSDYYTGTLDIYVVDPIMAPSSVAPNITFLVEMCAAPDIEFSALDTLSYTPIDATIFQSKSIFEDEPVVFQSNGIFDNQTCSILNKTIGTMTLGKCQTDTSAAAMGEKITNLRLLLKRFNPIMTLVEGAASKYNWFLPYAFNWTDSTLLSVASPQGNDLYGEMCSMFQYSRGSVRLKVNVPRTVSLGDDNRDFMSVLYHMPPATSDALVNQGAVTYPGGSTPTLRALMNEYQYVVANMNTNSAVEIQVPQYLSTHSRSHTDCGASNTTVYRSQANSHAPRWQIVTSEAGMLDADRNTFVANTLRAGADDVNFGMFVSIPPMVENTV